MVAAVETSLQLEELPGVQALTVESLRAEQIETLLLPYLTDTPGVPLRMFEQLAEYLKLLTRWNARTNLTSIREPALMVQRHFGESLFAARHLGRCRTVLDFGSGAGFPGLPIQLLWPELRVTLAESQNKKATFLREVVRSLSLETEVWAGRVEAMPPGRRFDVVALRAVDDIETAMEQAALRADATILLLSTIASPIEALANQVSSTGQHSWRVPAGFVMAEAVQIPETEKGHVVIFQRKED